MSYNSSYLTNVHARTASDTAAVFYYANWDTDDLTTTSYVTSASAVGLQQYDLIYAIHPVNGGQKWYVVKEVVGNVPDIDLLGSARDIAYVDLATLGTDISSIAKWYSQTAAAAVALAPVESTPSRTLNSAFQPSATKPTLCVYTVRCSTTLTAIGTSTAQVDLLSDVNTSPTTVRASGRNTQVIGVGITINQQTGTDVTLTYLVPAGHYVKLASTLAGGGTATLISQTEIAL